MASVKFLLRGEKNPSPIYLRFVHTREIDMFLRLNILINPKHFDKKKETVKNVLDIRNREEINLKLSELKVFIITSFNSAYINGETINKEWLQSIVNTFFNRSFIEDVLKIKNEEVYLSDFATWWLDNKASTHKVSVSKYMSDETKLQYSRARDLIIEFEKKKKIKLIDVSVDTLDRYSEYLTLKEYSSSTIVRHIRRIRFFCERAEQLNIQVNKGYKGQVFVKPKEVEYKDPYLTEEEIDNIYNLNIKNVHLNNVRDNFIIGLCTGLRISDFLHRLSIDNIDNVYIKTTTKKTNHKVAIPIHPYVIEILQKRNGELPPSCDDAEFNVRIKEICKLAKINELMIGGVQEIVSDPVTGEQTTRKKVDKYKKYELVTSHICRRSFATNLFNKVPNKVIMDVCGWKSERQMLDYNKQTNMESANILAEYWNNKKKQNKAL
jgi:integrase